MFERILSVRSTVEVYLPALGANHDGCLATSDEKISLSATPGAAGKSCGDPLGELQRFIFLGRYVPFFGDVRQPIMVSPPMTTPAENSLSSRFLTCRIMYFTSFCMDTLISTTETVRHLGDVLARVKYKGEHFLLTKNARPVARLVPTNSTRFATGAEINRAMERLPSDPEFADDLERVNRADQIPANPWA